MLAVKKKEMAKCDYCKKEIKSGEPMNGGALMFYYETVHDRCYKKWIKRKKIK